MVDERDENTETESEESASQLALSEASVSPASAELVSAEIEAEASELGATRYVHAAFFGATVLVAFISGKLLLTIWNSLADWPRAAEFAPFLLNYDEDKRSLVTVLSGVAVGLAAIIYTYRKEGVRRWANEVATELAKVTWPSKEAVQNGMVVVLIAGAIFTTYIALLDRIWGFLTTLVYGA